MVTTTTVRSFTGGPPLQRPSFLDLLRSDNLDYQMPTLDETNEVHSSMDRMLPASAQAAEHLDQSHGTKLDISFSTPPSHSFNQTPVVSEGVAAAAATAQPPGVPPYVYMTRSVAQQRLPSPSSPRQAPPSSGHSESSAPHESVPVPTLPPTPSGSASGAALFAVPAPEQRTGSNPGTAVAEQSQSRRTEASSTTNKAQKAGGRRRRTGQGSAGDRNGPLCASQSCKKPSARPARPSGAACEVDKARRGSEQHNPEDNMHKSAKRQRGGRKAGSLNFSDADVRELLRLIRKILPIGELGWNKVQAGYAAYASRHGRPKRDVRSLRLKYYRLVNSKKQTGDPECPEEVREAKRIDRAIEERVLMSSMNDDDDPLPADWEDDKNVEPDSEDSDAFSEHDSDDPDIILDASSGDEHDAPEAPSSREDLSDGSPGAELPRKRRMRVDDDGAPSHKRVKSDEAVSLQASRPPRDTASVRRRHRERASDLLSSLQQHLDPEARAARDALREQARAERFAQLLHLLDQRSDRTDERAEIRELRRQVDELQQQLMNVRMENFALQNQLQTMQYLMMQGATGHEGYSTDVNQYRILN
ncbi:hypothetical protein ACG7TL_001961 [Trametes sanguinea]